MSKTPTSSANEASQSVLQRHIALLDTDIGDDIDDALALALILQSPEIDLRGVSTVFGDTRRRARLAAHLLQSYGREDVPIAAGVSQPLRLHHRPSGVPQAAILAERRKYRAISPLSGPELIVQTALAHPGQLTLICIGPLTNVATALQLEPCIVSAIRRIVIMGGTGGVPLPEWNVRSDTRAAQIVLGVGIAVTLVGLNVTWRCQLRAYDLAHLRNKNTPRTQLLSQLIAVWQRHRPRGHSSFPYLHDPLAVAAVCAPQLFRFEEMTVKVLSDGPFKGYMVPRFMPGPRVQAAVHIKVAEARNWVLERLLK